MTDSLSTQCTNGQPSSALSHSASLSSPLSCHQPTSDDPHSSCHNQPQQHPPPQQPASAPAVHTLSDSLHQHRQPTSSPLPTPPQSLPPPLTLTPAAYRRLRGFTPIDRTAVACPVHVLKRHPSSLSASAWKPRVAVLAFGCLRLCGVAAGGGLAGCVGAGMGRVWETDGLSLNYAHIDVVGYDSATSLYIVRFLAAVSFRRGVVIPRRRWYVMGVRSAAECKALVNACSEAVAHSLSIHYTGDGGKVRLREPVEPALPEIRSVLGWKERGWRGEVSIQPMYEDEGEKMVERKVGETRSNDSDTEDIAPSAYLVHFSTTPSTAASHHQPSPLTLLLTPPALLTPYDLPPASFVNPLLDRLYRNKVGFGCLTALDRQLEASAHSSLLFGEVLPGGVTKLLDEVHLDVRWDGLSGGVGEGGVSVVDMGSGVGKLCLQLLLQYECVTRIEGIELAISRYRLGKQAMMELVEDGWGEGAAGGNSTEGGQRRQPHIPYHLVHTSPTSTTIASPPLTIPPSTATTTTPTTTHSSTTTTPHPLLTVPSRTLTLTRANLFSPTAVQSASTASIVVLETLITADCLCLLTRLLECLRPGCRVLTFHDVRGLWGAEVDAENVAVWRDANAKRRAEQEAAEPGTAVESAGDGEEEVEGAAAVDELPALRYAECPLVQLPANASKLDRFMTSWSQRRGHYFFLYQKVM